MNKISLDAKGFYFFDFEIDALKEAGFVFKKLKKKRSQKGRVFRIIKNPEPIEFTPERKRFIKNDLPLKMGAIYIEDNINIKKRKFNIGMNK